MNKPPVKILLVDDKENNLLSLQLVLEGENYILKQATSGKEVLGILLKEVDFALILMDVEMPDMNGFETANLIYAREKLRTIPIVFITANNYSEENIFKGYHAGAADYIYKPFNPDLLRAKVAVFADLYRKNQRLIEQEKGLQIMNHQLEAMVQERIKDLIVKNEELEIKNSELQKVNDDLDNFVYTASHDLKAPVTNIQGLMGSLVDSLTEIKELDNNTQTIVEMIDQSINRFKHTIQDLNTITKIQKDTNAEQERINLKEMVDDVAASLQDLISEAKPDISYDIDEATELTFSKNNLRILIFNLLSNAMKFRSENRQLKIRIAANLQQSDLVFTVKDNGIGIAPANIEKIFTMFKRFNDKVPGRGIGLYLVKRIITNAGGNISVSSILGEGTEFKVYLKR